MMNQNNEKKKLRRKCSNEVFNGCIEIGFANEDVFWTEDPFNAEIYGDYTKMWLCSNCIKCSYYET
jgi:hypothetical protein